MGGRRSEYNLHQGEECREECNLHQVEECRAEHNLHLVYVKAVGLNLTFKLGGNHFWLPSKMDVFYLQHTMN